MKYRQNAKLRLLNRIAKLIDLDQFYSIRLDSGPEIMLQGEYDNQLLRKLERKKFKIWTSEGMTYAQRGPLKFIFS